MYSVSLKAMLQVGLLAHLLSTFKPSRSYETVSQPSRPHSGRPLSRHNTGIRSNDMPTQVKNYSSESARDFHPASLPAAVGGRGASSTLLQHDKIITARLHAPIFPATNIRKFQ